MGKSPEFEFFYVEHVYHTVEYIPVLITSNLRHSIWTTLPRITFTNEKQQVLQARPKNQRIYYEAILKIESPDFTQKGFDKQFSTRCWKFYFIPDQIIQGNLLYSI